MIDLFGWKINQFKTYVLKKFSKKVNINTKKFLYVDCKISPSALNLDFYEKIKSFRKEALNLRFQKSSGQLENTSRISKVKKEIARIKTIINEKKKV